MLSVQKLICQTTPANHILYINPASRHALMSSVQNCKALLV